MASEITTQGKPALRRRQQIETEIEPILRNTVALAKEGNVAAIATGRELPRARGCRSDGLGSASTPPGLQEIHPEQLDSAPVIS